MKTILLSTALFTFSSCYFQRPVHSSMPYNNTGYKVDYLFEYGGCKVYRFYDLGNYVYFTNCKGETISMTDSTAIRNKINLVRQ